MGTRRSRHNKGRKPFYKEHRQNLVEAPDFDAPIPEEAPVSAMDYWHAYKRRGTGNMMTPGLNSLSELIVRPGIEKKMWPLLQYRGSFNLGRAHRMWNYALMMMAAEAETVSDGVKLWENPAYSQLCGPTTKMTTLRLRSFFGRLWDTPFVTDNIPGFTKYVKDLNLGPSYLTPVPLESERANVAPWRKSLHPEPHRYPGERGSTVTFYPYAVHDHERPDDGRALVLLVNKAVPESLPPDIRADVCQEIIVSVLAGDVKRENVPDHVAKYISQHFRGRDWKWAPDGSGISKLDAPLSFDDPDGQTLHDVLHDGSYRHWANEVTDEDEDDWHRTRLRNVLAAEKVEDDMRERRSMYWRNVVRPHATKTPETMLMEKEDVEEETRWRSQI